MASQTDDSNRHPWKKNAWQSRQAVSEALVALPKGYSPHKSVAVSEYHELAQTYLFEYFSVFEPKKDQFGGDIDPEEVDRETIRDSLWWAPVTQVQIPVDGVVQLNGDADMLKNGASDTEVFSEIAGMVPKQGVTVRLGSLRWLFQDQNTFQVDVKGWVSNQGPVSRPVSDTRYLPVTAIHDVRRQLDECLEQAGWLPDIESTPRTEITDEMLEEVEEWRRQNIGE